MTVLLSLYARVHTGAALCIYVMCSDKNGRQPLQHNDIRADRPAQALR